MISPANWLLFLLANAALLVGADAVACALGRDQDPLAERILLTGLAGLGLATVLVLGLGLAGLLGSYPLAAAAVLAGAGLRLGLGRRPLGPGLRQSLAGLAGSRDLVLAVAVLVFLLQAGFTLARIWYLPPLVSDSYSYHLPPVAQWLQLGRIPLELPGSVSRMNFQPLGMTLLNTWCMVFLGRPELMELPQFLWWLLLVLTGQAALRRAGMPSGRALLFALAAAFVPSCLLQSGTTQDHLALGVSFLAGVYFLDAFARDGVPRHLVAAGLALGLCLGYKLSAPLHVLAALGAVALLRPCAVVSALRAAPRAVLRACLAAVGLGLVLGGWWYAKNLVLYGRLQGQVLQSVGGGGENAATFHLGTLAANLDVLLFRLSDTGNLLDADLAAVSGFGPQFPGLGLAALALALPAYLAARRSGRPGLGVYVAAAVGLFLAYFLFYYSNNQYRLLLFLPAVLVWSLPVALDLLGFAGISAPVRTARGLALVCILWSAVVAAPVGLAPPALVKACVMGPAQARVPANVSMYMAAVPAQRFLANAVPHPLSVAYTDQRDSWTWQYYGPGWAGHPLAVPLHLFSREASGGIPRLVPSPAVLDVIRRESASLLVSSPTDNMLAVPVSSPEFLEIVPGLYYDRGAGR